MTIILIYVGHNIHYRLISNNRHIIQHKLINPFTNYLLYHILLYKMPISFSLPIKQFNLNVPRSLAIPEYQAGAADLGLTLNRDHTDDNLGVAHMVYSPAEFAAKYPAAVGQPARIPIVIARPDALAANATGAEIHNDKQRWIKFDMQTAAAAHLESQVESGYPSDLRASIEENFSLMHLQIFEQFQELIRLNPVSEQDLLWLKSSISAPFPTDGNIGAFTNIQMANLAHLARLGQPIASLDAIKLMFSAHQTSDDDRLDYAAFLIAYEIATPILLRTVANYCAAIILFVNNVLPTHRIANKAARAILLQQAHSVTQMQIAAPAVSLSKQRAPPNSKSQSKGSFTALVAPPGKPKFYCWTCGVPADPTKQHYSTGCNNPKTGHCWDATMANQMGGKKP